MHFGEYLVKRKILSPHQILKALDEQRRRRHFVPLLLVEQGALPDYQALKYCAVADENYEDFVDVLLDEGIVSEEQCAQIRAAWMRSGPPLGRLLVELGFIDEATRAEALSEYELSKSLVETPTSAHN